MVKITYIERLSSFASPGYKLFLWIFLMQGAKFCMIKFDWTKFFRLILMSGLAKQRIGIIFSLNKTSACRYRSY